MSYNFNVLKVSAIIPTYNEEDHIEDAIKSVNWADEVIVVDSFSNDKTIEIAKKNGAKVIQREYQYSASQKNWAIPQASFEWIFLLDADERVTKLLRNEIKDLLITNLDDSAYWIKRQNYFMGKKIRFSGWQGDKVIRLFKRDECLYEDKKVHSEIQHKGNVGILHNSLKHFTFKSTDHYLEKWDRYSSWSAKDHYKKGKQPNFFHFVIKPSFRFLRDYIFRLGILDGKIGFIICKLSSMGVFMRYVKLKEIIDSTTK